MPITNLDRDYGVQPSIVRMTTTDSLDTITASNYIIEQEPFIALIKGGAFTFVNSDVVCIYYQGGHGFFELSADFSTLSQIGGGTSLTIEGTANEIDVDTVGDVVTLSISPTLTIPAGATASSPSSSNNVATKGYVDAVAGAGGLTCYAASTANLSGYVYNNGTAGVGATLTAGSDGVFTSDGVTVPINQPFLYKDDTDGSGAFNGIYIVTAPGSVSSLAVLTRASYYDTPSDINDSSLIPIQQGTTNAGTAWLNSSIITTIGVDSIVFIPFGLPSGVLAPNLGGTGVNNSTNTLTINADSVIDQNVSTAGSPTFNNVVAGEVSIFSNIITIAGDDPLIISPPGEVTTFSEFIVPSVLGQVQICNNLQSALAIGSFVNDPSLEPDLNLYKSRSTTDVDFVTVQTNDLIGSLQWFADDGTSFNKISAIEVNAVGTISTGVIPSTLSLFTSNSSGVLTSAVLIDSTQTLNLTNALPIASGGTGVTSVTIIPTSLSFSGWDSNLNLAANNFSAGYTTIVTSGSTTTLTIASDYQQYFTGTSSQTVQLPVVSTLFTGFRLLIVNNSSASLTVNSSGGNLIQLMGANTEMVVTCISTTGTSATSWNSNYNADTGGVSSITGTANQVITNFATGDITLSLPQSIGTTSNVVFGQVTAGNLVMDVNSISSTTGNIILNSDNTVVNVGAFNPPSLFGQFQVFDTAQAAIALGSFVNSAGLQPDLTFYKSRSNIVNSFSPVETGDQLGAIFWFADDGTNLNTEAASIMIFASGTISTGIIPGIIQINTANASGTLTEAVVIDDSQTMTLTNPLGAASGGTGVDNGANLLTISANSVINQDVSTAGSPAFVAADIGDLTFTANLISTDGDNLIISPTIGKTIVGGFDPSLSIADLLVTNILQATFGVASFINNAGDEPTIGLYKSRSSTIGTRTPVAEGDTLGDYIWCGDDGTTVSSIASSISVQVADTVSTGIVPGAMFINTANSSGILVPAIVIDSTQVTTLSNPLGVASGGLGLNATVNQSVLTADNTGDPIWIPLTDGQIIIGSTSGSPAAGTITAGTGINVANSSNGVTISTTGASGLAVVAVSGTTQIAAIDTVYYCQNAGLTTITLPTTFALGDIVGIKGIGAGGWILVAATGDVIQVGNSPTSSGGSVASSNQYDTIFISGIIANTQWSMDSCVTNEFTLS